MKTITINIQDNKAVALTTALESIYPIPLMIDPTWVPSGDPMEQPRMIPAWTKNQHVKKCTIAWWRKQEAQYRQKLDRDAIAYQEDAALGEDDK